MNKRRINEKTENYHDWLIHSLSDSKTATAYLQVAIDEYQEEGNTEVFLLALRNVAEAQGGLGNLAKKTHLNRQNLYQMLSKKGNPRLDTLGLLLKGLGFHLLIEAI